MKHILYILSAFLLVMVAGNVSAQCDPNKNKDKCISQLADGYTFIKSYVVDASKVNPNGEVEYSFVFSSGTFYMITFVNENGESKDIEVKLYDPSHKLLATNYDKKNNKFFPIGFPCKTTGVHYMTFTFSNPSQKCGTAVLGFKR